jgi:hypothetical protein
MTWTFTRDDRGIHAAGGDGGIAGEVLVDEAFVVAEIEIGLSPVVGHEDLAVLEGVHRPGVDVDVGIELLHDHA